MGSANSVSELLFGVIPKAIHRLRLEVRAAASSDLNITQFRVLANIHSGICNIGVLAEYLGITQPGVSKLVDSLIRKGLISKKLSSNDLRKSELSLTVPGEALFVKVRKAAGRSISEKLNFLSSSEILRLESALKTLDRVLVDALAVNVDIPVIVKQGTSRSLKRKSLG